MIANVLLLIVGFALLIKGADVFVDASVGIAQRFRVPSVIIGLTIVAFGTSTPEAVVSISAAISGAGTLATGNVVGSNMFNLLFVIGLCGLLKPFSVDFKALGRDFWASIIAGIGLMLIKIIFDDYVPRIVSVMMLVVFALYMFFLLKSAAKGSRQDLRENDDKKEKSKKPKRPLWQNICIAVVGCGLIVFGGQLAVSNAVDIALAIGITQRVVGLTIVAVGTSLPELATSLVAAKKGETGIALGNVVGSNILNILFVLGISGVISPLIVDGDLLLDMVILNFASLAALFFVYTGRKVERFEGLIMVLIYLGYTTYIIMA